MKKRLQKECESATEYVLPDYMGDIKKLLMSKGRAVPTGKYVADGAVEVSGIVEYDIVYLDAEGKLTAANATSDFNVSFPIDEATYIDSLEQSRSSALKVRVTGPRKISLRSDVEVYLSVSAEFDSRIEGNVFSDEERNVEKCTADVVFASSVFALSGEREYAEAAERFEGVSADEVEIVSVSGVCSVREAVAGEGEVFLKGENKVSAVLLLPDRPPVRIRRSIPFDEVLKSDAIRSGMTVIGEGFISSADVGLGMEADSLNVVFNIIAEYSVEAMENESASVVTDAYVLDGECKTKYSDTKFLSLEYAGARPFCAEVRCNKSEEKLGELCDVIFVDAEAKLVDVRCEGSSCLINGEMTVSGVGYETNVDGSLTYVPIKIQSKFAEKVNIDCQNIDKMQMECSVTVEDCEVSSDSETLCVRCNSLARISLWSPHLVRTLVECERVDGEAEVRDGSVVTVYYPKEGDTLFDVAKKYKTTVRKIGSDNLLSESVMASHDSKGSLVGIKNLIIR